jgi:hypothetical protein
MSNKRFLPQEIALLALIIMILALAACQGREQLEQGAATMEAAAESVEAVIATEEATGVPPIPKPSPVPPPVEPTPEPEIEPENSMTPFTSSDDSLSFVYPNGWSVEDIGPGNVTLANSDAASINITLVPANMLTDFGLHLGNTAEEALQFIESSGLFVAQQEDMQVGNIQGLELEHTASAAQLSIATSNQEGTLITAMHSDQVVAFISAITSTGEYANLEESVRLIVDSINVSVTADEMIALIASSVQE